MDQIIFSEAEYKTKKAQTPPLDLSGTDGLADSLEAAGEESSPLLPQGSERTASVPVVCHAARPLHAAVYEEIWRALPPSPLASYPSRNGMA